jgi:hypothetical protein
MTNKRNNSVSGVDVVAATTATKRTMDKWEWMKLASKFKKRMEFKIREDFEEYVEQIRVSTNGFKPNKLKTINAFNWKHLYEYEWSVFIKEIDEDLLCDALKYYEETPYEFINDNYVLGKYLKELACEEGVKVTYYQDQQSGEIYVFITGHSSIHPDVVRVSNFICCYVSDYREKMQRGKAKWTDTIHINKKKFSESDFRMLIEDEDFTELVEWRCQDCKGEMIDNIEVTKTGVNVYIDC